MRKSEQRALEEFPEDKMNPRFINLEDQEKFYRYIYIKAYEQAEKDKNEEIYNDKTVLPKAEAVKFAFDLFDQFAKELITALGNTAKNRGHVPQDANPFVEIKDRILKEYALIMQPIEYNWPIDEIYNEMKISKNDDVDTLINEDKYRGRNDYHRLMVFKGKLADMLEHYACSSFDLGVKYQEMKDKGENVSTFKDVVIDELAKIEKPNREDIEL